MPFSPSSLSKTLLPLIKEVLDRFQSLGPTNTRSLSTEGVDPSLIQDIFHRIVPHYDLMNDLMSGGLHRFWKDDFLSWINPRPQDIILDLASGTGDMAQRLRPLVDTPGYVVECDLSHGMLVKACHKAYDSGDLSLAKRVQAHTLTLPFPDDHFDKVCIAFGLRNMPSLHPTLREIHRILKPQGVLSCLEFSHITHPTVSDIYDLYGHFIVPYLGDLIAHDREAYTYLIESIRQFVDQNTLCSLFEKALFSQVCYENRLGGLVALHRGSK